MDHQLSRNEFDDAIATLNTCDRIIVEGKKDVRSLSSLGVPHSKLLPLNGAPLYTILDAVLPRSNVALLTDLDGEGKKLHAKLKPELVKKGVFVDEKFREFLFRRTPVRVIEGLEGFVEKLE